jgi:hypothetical protein
MTTPSSTPDWPVWLARRDVPAEDKVARLAEYVAAHGALPKGCDFLWSQTSKLLSSGQSSAAVLPQLFPRLPPKQLALLLRGAPEANTRTLFAGLIAGSVQEASLKPMLSAFVRVVDEERLGSLVRSLGQLAGLYPADEPMMGQRLLAVLRKLPQDPARFSQHLATLRAGARWLPQGDDRVRAWRQFHESFERFVKACRQKSSLLTGSGLKSEREDAAQQLVADLSQAMPAQWYADDPQASAKRQLLAGLIEAAKLPADGLPRDFEKKSANYFQTGKWAVPPPPPTPAPMAASKPAPTPGLHGAKPPSAASPGTTRASGAPNDVPSNAWMFPVVIGMVAIVMLIGVAVYQAYLLHGRQVAGSTPAPSPPPAGSKDTTPPVGEVPKPTPDRDNSPKPGPDPTKPAAGPAAPESSTPPGGADGSPASPAKQTPSPPAEKTPPRPPKPAPPQPWPQQPPQPIPATLPGFPIAEEPKEEVAPKPSQTPSAKLCDLDLSQPIPSLYLHGKDLLVGSTATNTKGDGAESIEVKHVSFASDDPKRESYTLAVEADNESEPQRSIAKFVLDKESVHLQIQPSDQAYVRKAQSRLRFCVLEVRDDTKKSSRFVALQKPRRNSFPLVFDGYLVRSEADLRIESEDAPSGERLFLGAGRLIHNSEGRYEFGSEVAAKEPIDHWRLSTLIDQLGLSRFEKDGLRGFRIAVKENAVGAFVLAVETEPDFVELQDVYMKAMSKLAKVRQLIADLQDPSFKTRFSHKTPDQRLKYLKDVYLEEDAELMGTPLPPSNRKSEAFERWAWSSVLNLDTAKKHEAWLIACLKITGRPPRMDMQDAVEEALQGADSLQADVYRIVEVPESGGGEKISVRVLVIGRPK